MRSLFLLLFLLCSVAYVAAQPAAVINEWSNGPASQQEWVEIIVLEDGLDMRGWRLVDGNSNLLLFGQPFQNLTAGTIILVYNYGLELLNGERDPILDNINFNGSFDGCRYTFYPNDLNFASIGWGAGNAFANGNLTDNPKLLDADSMVVHDWDFNDNPGFAAGALRPGARQGVRFIGSNFSEISDPAFWERLAFDSPDLTPGVPNNTANADWIEGLRGNNCAYFSDPFPANTIIVNEEAGVVTVPLMLMRNLPTIGFDLKVAILPTSTATLDADYSIGQPFIAPDTFLVNVNGGTDLSFPLNILTDAISPESDELIFLKVIPQMGVGVVGGEDVFAIQIQDIPSGTGYRASASSTTVCAGAEIQLNVMQSNGDTPPPTASFSWEPAALLSDPTSQSPDVVAIPTTTTFTVTVTDGPEVFTAEVQVEVLKNDLRLMGIFQQPLPVDGAAYFLAAVRNGTKPYSYSLNGGTPVALPLFRNLNFGNYTVTVTDAAGCELEFNFLLD